jgi:hypothetical protein
MRKVLFLFSFLLLIIINCSTEPEIIHGCIDSQACNYNPNATLDNNSCIYPTGCDNSCGSTLENDQCGVCGGGCYNPYICPGEWCPKECKECGCSDC